MLKMEKAIKRLRGFVEDRQFYEDSAYNSYTDEEETEFGLKVYWDYERKIDNMIKYFKEEIKNVPSNRKYIKNIEDILWLADKTLGWDILKLEPNNYFKQFTNGGF